MLFSIVSKQSHYRGLCRIITATELYTDKTKKVYKHLLEKYIEFQSVLEGSPSKEDFAATVAFYHLLLEYGIPCEMVACDEAPLTEVFGQEALFLGIDIMYDLCESYIAHNQSDQGIHLYTNSNGLFSDPEAANLYIKKHIQENLIWKPCWVYQVIC